MDNRPGADKHYILENVMQNSKGIITSHSNSMHALNLFFLQLEIQPYKSGIQ